MTCARCQHTTVKKFGAHGRRKIERYRCNSCGATFSENRPKALGNHYIDFSRAVQVISLPVEGMSIRAAVDWNA
jgi:transposase-like protein